MQQTKWLPASEIYNTSRDPLHGKRLLIKAEHGNAVRDEIAKLMPSFEISKALGDNGDAMRARAGKFSTIRIRADLIGFIKALRIRYQANTGEDISMPNIVSLMALHGMEGVLQLPEFRKPHHGS